MNHLTDEQKRWIGAQLTKEERKAIIRVSYGGNKDLQFYIAESKINDLLKTMNTPPPQSIPAADFKLRFDTSTTAGKIAVMQEAERVGYVYVKQTTGINWRPFEVVDWGWGRVHEYNCDYNFPAEPRRVLIPWTKDTVPRDCWLRYKNSPVCEFRILSIDTNDFAIGDVVHKYTVAFDRMEHSLDNGRTWLPCGTWKEEV